SSLLSLLVPRPPPSTLFPYTTLFRSALPEVLLADLPPVLAGRDPQPDPVRAVHHRAVGAAVHPVLLRIAHDHQVVGADVAPAVVLVQERRGEFQDVYITVFQYVFQDWPVVYYARRNGLVHLPSVAIGAHHVERMRRHREAERDRQPARGIGKA